MRGNGLLDFAGLLRVGAQSGDDVNPVAAVELIEVSQVVLAVQRSVHQVADDVAFFGIWIPRASSTARTADRA